MASERGKGETRPKRGALGSLSLATQTLAGQQPAGKTFAVGLFEQLPVSRECELFIEQICAVHG
jgi:hypothetical protein